MTATLTPTDRTPPSAHPVPGAAPRPLRERVGLGVLLVATAGIYLWNLAINGWANDFYAGAVAAMTKNWEAFFFGSSDAGNTVTVDKPPASLWVQALSARIFGLSSWSTLVPQALMAVATVALLHAAVRRVAGPGAALVAGAAMALTPVAVLMFRFNNPDAMLVLLTTAAAYAVVRAMEKASTRWILLAGVLMGLAFLTKTAQSFLVLPGLALAYLWAAPTGTWRRIRQLLGAGIVLVVSTGWWFLLAALWPPDSRPYIGGSTNNSALELAFGYNGLGRILGQGFSRSGGGSGPGGGRGGGGFPGGGGPGGGGGSPFGGGTGIGRLFASDVGGQISWLLPAALVVLAAGFVLTRRAARTDALRASLLLWGGVTVVSALVFSFMEGVFHQYYTVALAPGIAALVGIGGALLWQRREALWARLTLAVAVLATIAWAWVLLDRTPTFVPWLKWVVVALGVIATVALLPRARMIATGGLLTAIVAGLLGPAAYTVDTVDTAQMSGIPLAGPATAGGFGGAGGFGRQRDRGANGGAAGTGVAGPAGAGALGGGGAPGRSGTVDAALVHLLQSAGTKWSAATTGASSAAPLALATGTDVMGIGGFIGSDPAPTLARFQADVAAGQIHYFIVGDGLGGFGGQQTSAPSGAGAPGTGTPPAALTRRAGGPGGRSGIGTWVEQHYTASTVGGRTVYDLTRPAH